MQEFNLPEDSAFITEVDHFSNACNIKLAIFPPLFKNGYNRRLTEDYKNDLVKVRFYFNKMLDAFEKCYTLGTKSGFFR